MLVVMEKSLELLGGHEHTQIEAISRLSGGRALTILTNHQLSVIEDSAATRVLPVLATRREHKRTPGPAHDRDVAAVTAFLDDRAEGPPVAMVVPTAELHEVRVCLAVLARRTASATFYLRILLPSVIGALDDSELSALQRLVESGSVVLLTETISLSRHLAERFNLPARNALLLPCSIDPREAPLDSGPHQSPFRIGYLGGARKEKGAEQIPRILSALSGQLNRDDPDLKVEIVMQQRVRKLYRPKHMLRDYRIRRASTGGLSVTTYPGNIATPEFGKLLQSMDVLLVPYELEAYRNRGSGIIIDGVMAERPIVHTRGIGMNEFLEHGNAEAAATAKEFAEKIVKVLSDIDSYAARAPTARQVLLGEIDKTAAFLTSV